MNKHFICNLLFDTISCLNDVSEFGASVLVITRLGINHVDQCPTLTDGLIICSVVLLEFLIAGEIFDIKLDVRIIIDFMVVYMSGRCQEESLMRRHLLEDDLLDASFARLGHAHQQYIH